MLLLNKSLGIFLLVTLCHIANAQSYDDITLFKLGTQSFETKNLKTRDLYKDNLHNNGTELQFLATGLFFIYKEFISSQDFSSCAFHPSCSVYGLECVKNHGIFTGGIMTFDRLTRCNGFSSEKYNKDYKNSLLIDLPKN